MSDFSPLQPSGFRAELEKPDILATTQYVGVWDIKSTTSTTPVRIHTTTLETAVTFVAPPSGKVVVQASSSVRNDTTSGRNSIYSLVDVGTGLPVPASNVALGSLGTNTLYRANYHRLFTGLTPGQTYVWALAQHIEGGSNGSAQTFHSEPYPILMEVRSA
jgi:hypothetical protein